MCGEPPGRPPREIVGLLETSAGSRKREVRLIAWLGLTVTISDAPRNSIVSETFSP
jgi:hypothetical protein